MPGKLVFDELEDAVQSIYDITMRFMMTDGAAWLRGKLKTSIIRSVYRRKPSKSYKRTNAFADSVRSRVFELGHNKFKHMLTTEVIAYPDPTEMNPHHTSWMNDEPEWNGMNVDENLTEWLEEGHGGLANYKAARFIERMEEELDSPKGFLKSWGIKLRDSGFKLVYYK